MWVIGIPFFILGLSTDNVAYMILGVVFGIVFYANDVNNKKKQQ